MSHPKKENGLKNQIFKWGSKRGIGRLNKDIQFYESFTCNGVKYCLHDCVYFYCEGDTGTNIGKLVQIYETAAHERMVRAVWFFFPNDIRNFLGDYEPKWNEIFLASGKGKGLSNLNRVESIAGKCNVVCASNDQRNPQASEQQLEMADYIVYRSFDVGTRRILESFPDQICGLKVELFFNRRRNQMLSNPGTLKTNVKELTGKLGVLKKKDGHAVKDGKSCSSSPVVKESKNHTNVGDQQHFSNKPNASKFSKDPLPPNAAFTRPFKKRRLLGEKEGQISDDVDSGVGQDDAVKAVNKYVEVTRKSDTDKGKWFMQLPWKERLQTAHEGGSLVLFENLDPSLTSAEVEHLVWHALEQKVTAKMIQRGTFSSPHYGKALVIFNSAEAADLAIWKLQQRCLMLADGRPVVGSKGTTRDSCRLSGFAGHLVTYQLKHRKQSAEKRKLVSNSHCAQPNTIEYDMAIDWRLLYERSNKWWEALHKQQGKELEDIRSRLKMNVNK